MSRRKTAPEVAASGSGKVNVKATIVSLGLPARAVELLAERGVHDLAGWLALGDARRRIFGVTGRTVSLLDRAARGET